MQTKRVFGVGLLLLIVAAIAIWQSGFGAGQPSLPTVPETAAAAPAVPAAGDVAPEAGAATVAPATAGNTDQRIAVPASATIDESKPALVGRVVGPAGQPIAGAKVIAAPGMSFMNANGQFDFDFSDLDEIRDMDPSRMMTVVREQLADRVEVVTDAEGRFRVQAKGTSKAVGLRVLARGHAILDRRAARPTDRDVDVGTLSLQQGAIVAGRVLEPGGKPVVGAQVSRMHEVEARMMGGIDIEMPEMGEVEALRGGEAATTDEQGRFELLHLTPGDVTLRARHPDHPTAKSDTLPVEAGRELRDLLLTMQRGGEIRGVVTGLPAEWKGLQVLAAKKPRAEADPTGMMGMLGGDMADMLSEMGMSFGERTADIAPDGKFVLRGLARDTYRVWVGRTALGFAGNSVCSQRLEAMPGSTVELRFEPGISVTFTVVDGASGAPLERLWVRDQLRGGGGMADMMAMGMPQQQRLGTYPGGAVTVANVRPKAKQKLTLTVDAIGYASFERADIELPKAGNLDLGTIKLEPSPVLQVTVTDADSGRPVAQAKVSLSAPGRRGDNPLAAFGNLAGGDGPRQGRTDREGRCTLNRAVEDAGVVAIEAKGFAPFASEPLAFTKAGPNTFAATLRVGGGVDVTVSDPADKPVKDAVVEHRTPAGEFATKKTDAQGLARFDHLAPGTHSFRLGKDGGAMGMFLAQARARGGNQDDESWTTVDVADRALVPLRLAKKPSASLTGVVRENGVPLAGARVAFREGVGAENERDLAESMMGEMLGGLGGGNGRSGKTDDRGIYTLNELPEGEHRLQITHKGRAMPARVAVTLRNGQNTFDVELDMTTLRGVVKDPQGNPVDGARVRVKKPRPATGEGPDPGAEFGDAMEGMMPGMNLGGGSTIKTDAAGLFELRGVDPDVELLVQATAKGFAPATAKATAARGSTNTVVDLQLGAAGKVKVTVATDSPFAAVRARWLGDGEVPPVIQMLRKGKGTLEGLRPGSWELEYQGMDRGGDEPKKRTVEVIAGQTIEVDL